jgi:nucleoside-diphosphate-sugar epimerase
MAGKDWHKDYEGPAVEGTTHCLEAAAKEPCEFRIIRCRITQELTPVCPLAIKHVVVTSSFASIGDFSKPATEQAGKTYTEEDWNPITNEDCEKLTADSEGAGSIWYCASKKLAEKAAWDISKKASFKLSTICPPSK